MDRVVDDPIDKLIPTSSKDIVCSKCLVDLFNLVIRDVFFEADKHCARVLVVDSLDVYRGQKILLMQILKDLVFDLCAIVVSDDSELKVRVVIHVIFIA